MAIGISPCFPGQEDSKENGDRGHKKKLVVFGELQINVHCRERLYFVAHHQEPNKFIIR